MSKSKIFWLIFDFSYIFFSGMVTLALWQGGFGWNKIVAIVVGAIAFYDYCSNRRH